MIFHDIRYNNWFREIYMVNLKKAKILTPRYS
jgi:hypothetical protein